MTSIGDENADVDRPRSGDFGSFSQSQTTEPRSAQSFTDSPEDAEAQMAIWESLKGATHIQERRGIACDIKMCASGSGTEPTHAGADPFNQETDEEELKEAIRMPLEHEEGGEDNPPEESPESSGSRRSSLPKCRICPAVPVFPYDRKTRKFRVFRPTEELTGVEGVVGFCTHYVAVSYCWPEPVRDQHGNMIPPVINSQVRDLDGTQRRARALDQVLDAAVDLANSCGLRMI